jgi:hypothetical protein
MDAASAQVVAVAERTPASAFRTPTRVLVVAASVLLALAFAIALALPYGEWDAMSLGSWSRQIAAHWPHLHFATVGAAEYQRPLFYWLQGTLWAIFGFHQALGRVLSLCFSMLLLGAIAVLAHRAAPIEKRFAAVLAVAVTMLVLPFEHYIVAGLSDIPVAALVAATAAALTSRRLGRARLTLAGFAALLAVLAKTSALPGLAGLLAAILIGRRSDLRPRLAAATAVAAGTLLGLTYELTEARHVHMSLTSYLGAGTDGFYGHLANARRHDQLLRLAWLGPDLRVLLCFAILYALGRLALSHRRAACVAAPLAYGASWLGPYLAGDGGNFRAALLGGGVTLEQIGVLVLVGFLLFAVDAPAAATADRILVARALVWALPAFLVWAWRLVYDPRLLAPAWPPLVILMVVALLPAVAGARRRKAWLALVPGAAVVLLVLFAADDINGLGSSGWKTLRQGGISSLADTARMRRLALGGDFAAELEALGPQARGGDRIVTYDRRLPFYFGSRVDIETPTSCAQMAGRRILVLLESDEIRSVFGVRATSGFWEACRRPTLTKVAERPGAFAVLVNGRPRESVGGCGAPPPTPGLAVEFGRFTSPAGARELLREAARVGFVQAKVEQLGCASYRVVETGIPDRATGLSIVDEAATAHLQARLVGG